MPAEIPSSERSGGRRWRRSAPAFAVSTRRRTRAGRRPMERRGPDGARRRGSARCRSGDTSQQGSWLSWPLRINSDRDRRSSQFAIAWCTSSVNHCLRSPSASVEPAPVEVAVVAQLALLLSDSSSPVYAGGEGSSRPRRGDEPMPAEPFRRSHARLTTERRVRTAERHVLLLPSSRSPDDRASTTGAAHQLGVSSVRRSRRAP